METIKLAKFYACQYGIKTRSDEIPPAGCGKSPPAAFSHRSEAHRTVQSTIPSSLAAALLDGLFAHPAGHSDTDTAHELIVTY
ncbi:MAG TPA: hypothetical protein PKN47_18795 [Nitrospira sp.]|nr:hypothetical protein [Nitrospira sp.]